MNDNLRKALYAAIPIIVGALTTYGILTAQLGVVWANVAVQVVGFAYAASRATGNRFLDPAVRRAGYVLLPSIVALIGGYWSIDVALWTSVVTAIAGAIVATMNVDPDEVTASTVPPSVTKIRPRDDYIDGSE